MTAEDQRLVAMFESRDEQAIAETEKTYGGFCYSIAYRILQNVQDAEECVNDAMLRIWNAIPPAKPDNLRAFVITLTRRLALDRYDAHHAAKRGAGQTDIPLETLSGSLTSAADPARTAEQKMLREALGRFLSGLPKDTRIMFVERYWYMLSVREIAEHHGITQSRVKMSLSRTRRKLETFLMKEELL